MKRYDAAVIGSGLIGVASAYELAKAGYSVALLDAAGLSAGSSGANTGLLLFEGSKDSMMFDLCVKGLEGYRNLGEELETDLGISPVQMLSYFCHPEEFPQGEAQKALIRANGFPCDVLDDREVHEAEPGLRMDGILGGLLYEQWKMDPLRVVYGYFRAGRQLGVDWYPACPVTGMRRSGSRILALETPMGEIEAGQFVLAAGAWSRGIMAAIGIDMPQFYIQGAAMVAERGGDGPRNAVCHFEPKRIQVERRACALAMEHGWGNFPRQDGCEFIVLRDTHDNIITAQRSMVQEEMVRQIPPDFVRDMAQNLVDRFPGLASRRVIRSWICPIPILPDEKPFFGFVKPYDNLFSATGFASVLIMAPAIGALVRKFLTGGEIGYDFSEFDPRRFEGGRKA